MSSSKLLNRAASLASHLPRASNTHHAAMATAATVSLGPSNRGVFNVPNVSPDSYKVASQLLQKNHDEYHMYFNQSGFHNHILHHLATILALGASPSQIQQAFDNNASYQRPQMPVNPETVKEMTDPAVFAKYLGKENAFHDYEIYFRKEIENRDGNWGSMLRDHLLGPSPQAQDLLFRTFAGFYHPVIHLGFGIEFSQPAIIVEALAQAATHDNWPKGFLTKTTDLAKERISKGEKSRSLFSLVKDTFKNSTIKNSPHSSDGNKIRDGVFKRAMPEITSLCSQWHVSPTESDLKLKTAEMINFTAYFAGAAQHASHKKQIKFDFFYMHCINASIFYSAFLRPENSGNWLDHESHAKLLMYKGWSDLAMYVSRGTPELFKDEISAYVPKQPDDGWEQIFARVDALVEDDGHASKLVRAFANGEQACSEFEGKEESQEWMIKGGDWLQLAHMAIDSVEGPGPKWVRNAGFEEAWKSVGDRDARNGFGERASGGEKYDESH